MTLIELVIAIVVIAISLTGVLSVLDLNSAASADPALQVQAHAIGRSYLEEALLKAFDDPDGIEPGETRATFDDVDDYHALAQNGCLVTTPACPVLGDCVCDLRGEPVPLLAGFRVTMQVVADALNGLPAKRVDIAVSHARIPDLNLELSGYRGDY